MGVRVGLFPMLGGEVDDAAGAWVIRCHVVHGLGCGVVAEVDGLEGVVVEEQVVEHGAPSSVGVYGGGYEDDASAHEETDDILAREGHLRVLVRLPWSQKLTSLALLQMHLSIGHDSRWYI